MAPRQLDSLLRHLRRLADPPAGDLADGPLLQRFLTVRDEAAFATLLQRHGPMVLGVCRRLLADPNDADDVFQATFLVLVRKAASVRKQASVGSWLYGVACRTAAEAKVRAARRRRHERRAAERPPPEPRDEASLRDLRAVLDEELRRLPDHLRAPLVAHYLEGKTKAETAAALGWAEGTVSGRLARARDLLRGRLSRRGIDLAGGAVAASLAQQAAATPSAALTAAALEAALALQANPTAALAPSVAALVQGVSHAMFLTKLKTAAVLAVAAVLAAGAGLFGYRVLASQPTAVVPALPAPAPRPAPAPAAEAAARPEDRKKEMLEAVEKGDVAKVRALLRADATLANVALPAFGSRGKPSFVDGFSVLQLAVWFNYREIVQELLDHKADVNVGGDCTPLHLAAQTGRKDLARLLLDHKADVHGKDAWTPLHDAVLMGKTEVADLLLARGARLDVFTAAGLGNVDVLTKVLKADPARAKQVSKGSTPLHWAAAAGRTAAAELLLRSKADVNATAAWWGNTPLHEAAEHGHEAVAKLLLDNRAEVDARNKSGQTALLLTAAGGHDAVVRLLLARKADVNAREDRIRVMPGMSGLEKPPRWTALHKAAAKGHLAVVRLLLEAKAEVNARAEGEITPLHEAAGSGHAAVVKLLLASKADSQAKDARGHTPLDRARQGIHEDVVNLLRKQGGQK
jgi:RNA polymerase sigma factor (sigma-70 family)